MRSPPITSIFLTVPNPTSTGSEVFREGTRKLETYVKEMSSSNAVSTLINVDKVHTSVLRLWNVVQSQLGISDGQVSRIKDLYESVINSLNTKGPETKPKATPQPRTCRASLMRLILQLSTCSSFCTANSCSLRPPGQDGTERARRIGKLSRLN